MALLARSPAYSRITAIAGQRPVHEAFRWLHLYTRQMLMIQAELARIPAPPFGEEARSAWMAERFREAGLGSVTTDAIGNVFAVLPAADGAGEDGPVVLLSAHLDTVFPTGTPLDPVIGEDRLEGPGVCDNAAGVVGLLAVARAIHEAQVPLPATLVVCGNVGEEGEGDLRGVRHLYRHAEFANRIVAHLVLDGAGTETAVTQALGSRRYQITVTGPGGHSFTEAGTPNPIIALAVALGELSRVPLQGEREPGRTTMNVGTIAGGTSVNSVPESATAAVEFRSTAVDHLVRLEVALHRAVEDAIEDANALAHSSRNASRSVTGNGSGKQMRGLSFLIEKIGDRPVGELKEGSALLENLRAVDRHLGLRTDLRLGSTDANLPLSLGVPAVSLGAGGDGGGAHTRAEWYSAANRGLGLRRILLLTLAMLGWAAED
ncbi:MAG TPA: M20/M25/M40 family metallo-hydrolase [Acidobacteriaceae bacterium]|nr:M20/M25/M40 family metallo-hydrolase [Acidobacteriaceae bacterium]